MKKLHLKKESLESLLVIGLIFLIPLFFVIKTAADRQTVQNTAEPLATAVPD